MLNLENSRMLTGMGRRWLHVCQGSCLVNLRLSDSGLSGATIVAGKGFKNVELRNGQ